MSAISHGAGLESVESINHLLPIHIQQLSNANSVNSYEALDEALRAAKSREALSFIEVKASIGARTDLGRPTTTAKENKEAFMKGLAE